MARRARPTADPPIGGPQAEDAVRVLFSYIYYRSGGRVVLQAKIKARLAGSAKLVAKLDGFFQNYVRTSRQSDADNIALAAATRAEVWTHLRTYPPPSYMDSAMAEAFGSDTWHGTAASSEHAILQSIPDTAPAALKRYEGRYDAYRRSTRSDREKGAHYIRYYIEIFVDPDTSHRVSFRLCYRTRDRTEDGSPDYVSVEGRVVRRQQKLYFLAAEPERDNLLYIVCRYEPTHAAADRIRGLIVTENRYHAMVAAKIILAPIPAAVSEATVFAGIGVRLIDDADKVTRSIVAAVDNHIDRYALTWDN